LEQVVHISTQGGVRKRFQPSRCRKRWASWHGTMARYISAHFGPVHLDPMMERWAS